MDARHPITEYTSGVDNRQSAFMPLSTAIIGLGAAARNIHIPACNVVSGLDVVAGADPAPAGREFGFPVYPSIDEMLACIRPELAIVSTPPASHYETATALLTQGCDVLCEKPFMETLEQARNVVALADRVGCVIGVNNQFRFMESMKSAKARIDDPEFGDIRFIEVSQNFRVTEETEQGWRGTDSRRTCKEFGTHVFDLCRFFYGSDPVEVDARMPTPGAPDGPDQLNLIDLDFGSGRYARITLDRVTRGRHRYLDMRIDGANATIETSLGGHLAFEAGINPRTRWPYAKFDLSWGGRATIWHGDRGRKIGSDPRNVFANATANLLRDWLESSRAGVEPACSARDNLGTLAIMLAAYESAQRGQPVRLSEVQHDL